MDVVAWLLVVCLTSDSCVVLPTQYPSEGVCIASAKDAHVERGFDATRRGVTQFICIPGHSPLHGGREEAGQ